MQNVITCNNVVLNITKKQLPFGNNFEQISAKVVQYNGVDEIYAVVKCTSNSHEPGRIYSVNYSFKGRMEACNTLN